MTPEEFEKKMQECSDSAEGGNEEDAHIWADGVICSLLKSLGYE